MHVSGILSRYIFKELLGPFLLALLVFSSVALMTKLIDLMDMVVNKGIAPGQVLMLVVYLMPSLLIYTVPMSVVLAVLIALGRLSADSEIIALKASGINLYQMMPPFVVLCLTGFVLTAFCSLSLESLGRRTFRSHAQNFSAEHIAASLEGGAFNDSIKGLIIYVQEFDQGTLQVKNIMISDRRDPSQPTVIVAEHGIILSDQNNLRLLFKLYDGSIHRSNTEQKYEYAVFKTYQMLLPLPGTDKDDGKPTKHRELSLQKLVEQMYTLKKQGLDYNREMIEINKRFALPFSCLIFGLLGMSLGVFLRRGGRASGFMLSLFIVVLYFLLMNLAEEFCKEGSLTPAIGMWMPNGLMGALAVYLFYKSIKEKPFPFSIVYAKKIAPLLDRTVEQLIKIANRKKN
jgi:lipopolysaccharide export system permease protein